MVSLEYKFPSDACQYSSRDSSFYLWLDDLVKINVQHVRRLEIIVAVPFIRPTNIEAADDPSKAVIDIDLNCSAADKAISISGYYGKHSGPMILPYLRKAVSKIPRVERKPLVSAEMLWDIYEACYFVSRSDSTERRKWPAFTRAYELNRRKDNSRPWSETVWYESNEELIHGPGWNGDLASKRKHIPSLACR